MFQVKICKNKKEHIVLCNKGDRLSDVLMANAVDAPHPCAGNGKCGKCRVIVNGESVLSCRYIISSDAEVVIPSENEASGSDKDSLTVSDNRCAGLALDIGTTTMELVLLSDEKGTVADRIVCENPQKIFGADVLSRIDYCRRNGIDKLNSCLADAVNRMIATLLDRGGIRSADVMYVSANTAMLHMFFGIDCSSMAVSPYTPSFLDGKTVDAADAGISRVGRIESLPCISAFVGADIVAGLIYSGFPEKDKYNILVDLGTNAEVVLYSQNSVLCTSAAAGPCFECANISCGMSATEGAVCHYVYGEKPQTIGGAAARGICATGLVSIISELLKNGIIDETGYMEKEKFEIAENVYLTREDIRNFQLAKSAVYSSVKTLMKNAGVTFRDIDRFCVSGGIASALDAESAVITGLLPLEAFSKFEFTGNTSICGTIKYMTEKNNTDIITKNAVYKDLASDDYFSKLFIENMMFCN